MADKTDRLPTQGRDEIVLEILDCHVPNRWIQFEWSGDAQRCVLKVFVDEGVLALGERAAVIRLYASLAEAGYPDVSLLAPNIEL